MHCCPPCPLLQPGYTVKPRDSETYDIYLVRALTGVPVAGGGGRVVKVLLHTVPGSLLLPIALPNIPHPLPFHPAGAPWRGPRDLPVLAAHALPRRTLQPHV